jgi:hypothetical protein
MYLVTVVMYSWTFIAVFLDDILCYGCHQPVMGLCECQKIISWIATKVRGHEKQKHVFVAL